VRERQFPVDAGAGPHDAVARVRVRLPRGRLRARHHARSPRRLRPEHTRV